MMEYKDRQAQAMLGKHVTYQKGFLSPSND